jgi:multidrug efflux pump subunit AcrA (membrane-fusion protein)
MADPRAVEVESTVIEEDMSAVKLGENVNLFFDAKPDVTATGRVARIVPVRTTGDRLLYPIYISIDQLPEGLVAGMTVDASVVVSTRSDVLRLPRELVRVRSDGTAQIKVWTGDRIEQRTIKTGLRGDSFVEVIDGLREGDRVVSE